MQTPVARYGGRSAALYGENEASINRRTTIAGLAALAYVGSPATARSRGVRAIAWAGRAHVDADGPSRELIVETRVEMPLLRVRSRSRTAAEGPDRASTLILDPEGQWMVRDGTRMPLPAAIGIAQRQHYALYAYLLIVQQQPRRLAGVVRLYAPPLPPIRFVLGTDGFPIAADYTIHPDGDGDPIDRHVTFDGRIAANGVRWPRRITLMQNGKPQFTLDIDRLSVEPD